MPAQDNKQSVQQLNQQYAIKQEGCSVTFIEGQAGIPLVEISNQYARAKISLQGAHLLSWIPKGEEDVIWLSKEASYAEGKSIRGGVPICWPWFGQHASNADFPAHGFARTTYWRVSRTEALENGNTRIVFTTSPQHDTNKMWPSDTTVQFQLDIGQKLEMELLTSNLGSSPITISQALHTYFRVGDVSDTQLHGLDDTKYLDKLENFKSKNQHGPVTVHEEVDRIYLDTASDCVIEDRSLNRNIIIRKCGSHSTVVWNPWQATAEKMGDLGKDGYRHMLCVESSNAADDVIKIEPGKSHRLWVQYEVQALTKS
jgi:glucose-6-phosphate 1-epimerase